MEKVIAAVDNSPHTPKLKDNELLSLGLRLGWGLGSMPLTILNMALSVLLLRFMTDSLGIAAGIASLIFATAKIWDAISDPMMGMLSDRITTPWGRRLPWLLTGGLLSAASMVFIFCAPDLPPTALIIYLLVGKLMYATSYTMFMVPYMTMPTELTTNYHGRTQLMSFRVVFSSIGTVIGLSLAPALLAHLGADRAGHAKIAILLAMIAAIAVIICVWSLRDAPQQKFVRQHSYPSLKVQIRSACSNVPFIWLMSSKLTYFFVLTLSISTLAYFTKYVLQASDTVMGIYMGIQSVALICAQPIWLFVARRWGKRNGYILASAIFGIVHFSWWFAGAGEPQVLIVIRAILIGIAGGGTFLLSQAMLPDTLEYDHLRTGLNREGVFTGLYILVEKLSGAIGIAFVGLCLSLFGYIESTDGHIVVQPESVKTALYFCMAFIPALMQIVSIAIMTRYKLTAEYLAELRANSVHKIN